MAHKLIRPDGTVSYELAGEPGNPLVILGHGMADSSGTFRFLAPRLVDAGYRVATVDLRGHGTSSVQWPDYSTTAIAGDFLALIDELGGARRSSSATRTAPARPSSPRTSVPRLSGQWRSPAPPYAPRRPATCS